MSARKSSKKSPRKSSRKPSRKAGGNSGLIVFAVVSLVVGFAILQSRQSAPPQIPQPSQQPRALQPSQPSRAEQPPRVEQPPRAAQAPQPVQSPRPSEAQPPPVPAPPPKPSLIAKLMSLFAKPPDIDASLAGTFKKFDLTSQTLANRSKTEKRDGKTTYLRTYAEYEAPRAFSWRAFQPAVRNALKGTPFRVASATHGSGTIYDIYSLTINRGDLDVMELQISRKKPLPPPPPVAKVSKGPKIAIVIDDFGYSMNNVQVFLGMHEPITFSILPRQPHSAEIARLARSRGYEVILHLPMEALGPAVKAEADTIRVGMGESEIDANIRRELSDVPGASGVNNHQGSKATSDKAVMEAVLRYLKKNDLFFLDSMTTPHSVSREVAAEVGVKFAKRDRFLDNDNDPAAIEKQCNELKAFAVARGKAIAICHDRKNTAAVLARVVPEMAKEGINFVYLSDMEQ